MYSGDISGSKSKPSAKAICPRWKEQGFLILMENQIMLCGGNLGDPRSVFSGSNLPGYVTGTKLTSVYRNPEAICTFEYTFQGTLISV